MGVQLNYKRIASTPKWNDHPLLGLNREASDTLLSIYGPAINIAITNNPRSFKEALHFLKGDNLQQFNNGIKSLTSMPEPFRLNTLKIFYTHPNALVYTIAKLASDFKSLQPYITEQGILDLSKMVQKYQTTLHFESGGLARLYAIVGLIKTFNLKPEDLKIFVRDNNIDVAKKLIPNVNISAPNNGQKKSRPHIEFYSGFKPNQQSIRVTLPLDPVKYLIQAMIPDIQRSSMSLWLKLRFKIPQDRQVLVVASPNPKEIKAVLSAFSNLPEAKRPLVIIGIRDPRIIIKNADYPGINFINRDDLNEQQDFSNTEVVLLRTQGELADFMHLSSVSIVGHDRNMFEAVHSPILYFEGHWLRNLTAKTLLTNHGAAERINEESLHKQLEERLDHSNEALVTQQKQGSKYALMTLHDEIVPAVSLYSSLLIAKSILNEAETSSN
jgi:hypothetical protein